MQFPLQPGRMSRTAMRKANDEKKKEGKRNRLIRSPIPPGLKNLDKSAVQPVIYLADAKLSFACYFLSSLGLAQVYK